MTLEMLNTLSAKREAACAAEEAEARLRAAMIRVTPQLSLSGGKGPETDRMAQNMARLEVLTLRAMEARADYEQALLDVTRWMRTLNKSEAALIRARYLEGRTWTAAARAAGYADRSVCWRVVRRILKE